MLAGIGSLFASMHLTLLLTPVLYLQQFHHLSLPIPPLRHSHYILVQILQEHHIQRLHETMYERSIKTINGFSIFAEAEYWIQRELKVKLGWNVTLELVKVFDQLVRRRFS